MVSNPRAWFDSEGRLHEKLHVKDRTLILVRPDEYIGFRCQPAEGAAIIEYLDRYLMRKGRKGQTRKNPSFSLRSVSFPGSTKGH
jgi:hypothetical protein